MTPNGPTRTATKRIDADAALILAQILAIGLLTCVGARIGWRAGGKVIGTPMGAGLTGGVSIVVTLLKVIVH